MICMTKNLGDLHDYLFKQLERLDNDELKGEDLEQEINRANAITSVGTVLVKNATVALQATIIRSNGGFVPEILKGGDSLAKPTPVSSSNRINSRKLLE